MEGKRRRGIHAHLRVTLFITFVAALLSVPTTTYAVEAQASTAPIPLTGKMTQKICVMKQCTRVKERHTAQFFVVTVFGVTPTFAVRETSAGDSCINGGVLVDAYLDGPATSEKATVKTKLFGEKGEVLSEIQQTVDIHSTPEITTSACF